MTDRTCDLCGKAFPYPSGLRKHQARKTPCRDIVPVTDRGTPCPHCNRAYTQYSAMRRHVRTACKMRTAEQRQRAFDARTMRELKAENERLRTQDAPTINNITNNFITQDMSTNISNNVNLERVEANFMYGVAARIPKAEDIKTSHVTAEYLKQFLPENSEPTDLVKHAANLVLQTFRSMYGASVRISDVGIMQDNRDVKRVFVSQGRGAWESQNFRYTLSDWLSGALRFRIRGLRALDDLSIEQAKIVEMAQNAGFIRVLHDESAFRPHVAPETPELIMTQTLNELLEAQRDA